jgi:uncharacterized protein YbjQ (UPF0145 family)
VRFVSVPLLEDVVGSFSRTVLIVSGAVGILLLIACLNVTVLLFTRGASGAREIALRGALGAGQWRTVRQMLTETCLLAVLGGTLGLGFAVAAVRLFSAIGLAGLPRLQTLSVERNVLLFATACVVVTTFAVGLAPALRQARGRRPGAPLSFHHLSHGRRRGSLREGHARRDRDRLPGAFGITRRRAHQHLASRPLQGDRTMIMTTTDSIPGKRVVKVLGLVRGNTIRARHLGRDILAVLRNIVGGEITEYTKLMAESREQALDRMRDEAARLGANAIVGLRFTTSFLSAGAAELLAFGTAVVVEDD